VCVCVFLLARGRSLCLGKVCCVTNQKTLSFNMFLALNPKFHSTSTQELAIYIPRWAIHCIHSTSFGKIHFNITVVLLSRFVWVWNLVSCLEGTEIKGARERLLMRIVGYGEEERRVRRWENFVNNNLYIFCAFHQSGNIISPNKRPWSLSVGSFNLQNPTELRHTTDCVFS